MSKMTTTPTSPVAHRWTNGDRARIRDVPVDQRTYPYLITRDGTRGVQLEPGDIVTLKYKITDDCWRSMSDRTVAAMGIPEDIIEPISVAPASPATILYRVEYRDNSGDSSFRDSRAALVPIAGIAERLRLADILTLLSEDGLSGEDEPSDDVFMVALMGGVPAEPYASDDRVTIVSGKLQGEVWYLVERDEANGQRWWMAGCSGGEGTMGLHVDGFEKTGEGGDE